MKQFKIFFKSISNVLTVKKLFIMVSMVTTNEKKVLLPAEVAKLKIDAKDFPLHLFLATARGGSTGSL